MGANQIDPSRCSARWKRAGFDENGIAAESTQPHSPNATLDVYAKPARLVDIGGGRKLNLRCTGKGSPTVMREAGAVSNSTTWYKVQPQVEIHYGMRIRPRGVRVQRRRTHATRKPITCMR
jgi:hypothetical protein